MDKCASLIAELKANLPSAIQEASYVLSKKDQILNNAKSEAKQKATMTKIKNAIAKNNTELAKSYAQEALRHKADAQRYKTLGSKVNAIHGKLQQAYKTQQLMS